MDIDKIVKELKKLVDEAEKLKESEESFLYTINRSRD